MPPTTKQDLGRRIPRAAALALAVAVTLSIVNPSSRSVVTYSVDGLAKLVGIVACCGLANWFEERLFARARARRRGGQLLAATARPLLAGITTPVFVVALGIPAGVLGDDGTLALSISMGGFWFASTALGTLLVLLLDLVMSALLPDLRARLEVMVLGLVVIAVGVASVLFRFARGFGARPEWEELALALGGPSSPIDADSLQRLLELPETSELATTLFLVTAGLVALPAVLSACSKLSLLVLERVDALGSAFAELTRGRLDVSVEEGGSREFRELGRGFNRMARALVQAREEIERLNIGLEGEVAARTRELRGTLEQLRLTQLELVESERQAMVTRLTAGILHEINTPLGTLRSAADSIGRVVDRLITFIAARSNASDAQPALRAAGAGQRLAGVMLESTRRIERLMRSLGRFVSLDGAERQAVDVREGLDAALTLLAPSLGERVQVVRDYEGALPAVHAPPAKLNQIFLELCENAERALAEGGTLTVCARREGGDVMVQVVDNGRGIPPELQRTLFEFGFGTKQDGRVGLRLGLPSAKRWIEEIGGSISVESTLGRGTTVCLRMPAAAHRDADAAARDVS